MATGSNPTGAESTWSHVISQQNHGALVSIATSLLLAGTVLLLIIRLAIRWPWKKLVGWDDAAAVIGSLLAVGQSVTMYRAVYHGLGRHSEELEVHALEQMEKAIYTGDLLFICVVSASKLAVSLLLYRLSSVPRTIMAAHILMTFVGIWSVASLLAVSLRPKFPTPWTLRPADASHLITAWTGIGAVSCLVEFAFMAFPVFLVYGLQMPLASKLTVVTGFAFRLPVIVFTILRFDAFRNTLGNVADITWTYVLLAIYTELEMHASLMAATIPCMHIFLRSFNTGFLATTALQVDSNGTMSATKGKSSYAMKTVRSRHTQNSQERSWDRAPIHERGKSPMKLNPEQGHTVSNITHRDRRADDEVDTGSVESDGSDRIMVRKTVQIDYSRAASR
ncbi:hypothetical protein B0A48_10688 [Cryoendolithus antarcticus]|uniref:Rhodopsin domain-containing protein n=1 Tax=Cryoendolithus antarcticus TaxID=1507870 RepID=A0A1V8SY08_9PEZI|nr:hypothetical protein B0A48_10688 [Cryoendolithus antarcticus]